MTTEEQPSVVHHSSCLIIGGGISGLAAAVELVTHHVSVTLLEAQDRLGGRLHTIWLDDDDKTPIDMGGMYWHGRSPVVEQVVQEYDLKLIASGGTSSHPAQGGAVWTYDSQTLTADDVREMNQLFAAWEAQLKELYQKSNSTVTLDGLSQLILQQLSPTRQDWLKFQTAMNLEHDRGVPLQDLNPQGVLNGWDWKDYPGEDSIALDGIQSLITAMATRVRNSGRAVIRLRHRVATIEYGDDSCQITTTDGNIYTADRCIVTIPLGVLKERHDLLFEPRLPLEKCDAWDRSGVAAYNTLVVQWKQPVIETSATAYYTIGHADTDNPLRFGFVCPAVLRDGNACITQFYLSGADYDFDNLDYWKEQAVRIVHEINPSLTVHDIVDARISRWHDDPDFRGSYSAPTTLTNGNEDRKILASPVHDILFFAGEHTHYEGRYQSMDGAFETGVRAAKEVLESLQRSRTSPEAIIDQMHADEREPLLVVPMDPQATV